MFKWFKRKQKKVESKTATKYIFDGENGKKTLYNLMQSSGNYQDKVRSAAFDILATITNKGDEDFQERLGKFKDLAKFHEDVIKQIEVQYANSERPKESN